MKRTGATSVERRRAGAAEFRYSAEALTMHTLAPCDADVDALAIALP